MVAVIRSVMAQDLWGHPGVVASFENIAKRDVFAEISEQYSGLDIEELTKLMARPELSAEAKLSIEKGLFARDLEDSEYGEGFRLLSDKVDPAVRDRFMDYALENHPMKLLHSGQIKPENWERVKPTLLGIMDAALDNKEVPGFGTLDATDISTVLRYGAVPRDKLFSEDFAKYSYAIIDKFTDYANKELSRHLENLDKYPDSKFYPDAPTWFEDVFLFPGTPVGEKARPFAEITAEHRWVFDYFSGGYHHVEEIDDITREQAKKIAMKAHEYFIKHGLLNRPGLEEANQIYAERLASLFEPEWFFVYGLEKYPQFEEHLNNAKINLSRKANDMDQRAAYDALSRSAHSPYEEEYENYWVYTSPENYNSPEDHANMVNKALTHYKTRRPKADERSLQDQLRRFTMPRGKDYVRYETD